MKAVAEPTAKARRCITGRSARRKAPLEADVAAAFALLAGLGLGVAVTVVVDVAVAVTTLGVAVTVTKL